MTNKASFVLPRMRTRAAVSIKIATVVLAMVAGTLGVRERTAVVLL